MESRISARVSDLPRIEKQDANKLSFCDLGEEIIANVIVDRMVEFDVCTAISLSLTSKGFNLLFAEALLKKLLRLLDDVTRITTPNLQLKLKLINEFLEKRPGLMFGFGTVKMQSNGEMLYTSPIRYIYLMADIQFQTEFYYKAREINKTVEFLRHADHAVDNNIENIDEQYDAYNGYITRCNNGAPDQELDEYIRLNISAAQKRFPRWMLDYFFKCSNFDIEENDFSDFSMPQVYPVLDETDGNDIDLLDMPNDKSNNLRKQFALFRDDGSSLIRAKYSRVPSDDVAIQWNMFYSLFSNRIKVQSETLCEFKQDYIKTTCDEYLKIIKDYNNFVRSGKLLSGVEKRDKFLEAYKSIYLATQKLDNAIEIATSIFNKDTTNEEAAKEVAKLNARAENAHKALTQVRKAVVNVGREIKSDRKMRSSP